MNNNNTLYKDSPIGKIPEDWEVRKLGTLVDIVSGESPSIYHLTNIGKYPYLKVEDLNNCEKYQIESREYSNDERGLVPRNSIFFPKRGAAILNNKVRINSVIVQMDSNLMAIYPKSDELYFEYLYYRITYEQLHKIADTSTIPQINNKHIIPYSFLLPPLPEQKAIAHVLGLMDSAINANNQLIAKKELQKKWLMQNLLTGKKRLKGFGGEWNEYILKNCFHFIKSYSISRDGLSREQGKHYCIHYGDIHAYYETDFIDFKTQSGIPRINDNKVNVNTADYLHDGDIIIADASEDYEGVGEAVEVINIQDKTVVGGLHTIVLRDFSGVTSSLFRAYLFNSERVRNELRKKATGTSVYSVTKTTLESLVIKLPPLNEQRSIAMTLQAADNEIQFLKTKTEKLREQKKGLMQVLLTGKKRLTII